MENAIIIIILAAIVGGASLYLYKAKRRGENCIGCPYAKQCASHKGGHACAHASTPPAKDRDSERENT